MQALVLESTRFGQLEIPAEAAIEFPNGLIGLPGTRYALLARSDESAFVWLHSLEDPALALPVTVPWRFFPEYEVELSDDEASRLGVTDPEETQVYVTVRAAESLDDFTANLRAPILVAEGRGFQIINQASNAPVRCPLFQPGMNPGSEEQAA
ncbi:MAG: flagellar assembly protein FliW [Solirubrobacteraceae bacterium]|nr:flagellar assembly protein FliW [Solirubrobacteraceae bacterium]